MTSGCDRLAPTPPRASLSSDSECPRHLLSLGRRSGPAAGVWTGVEGRDAQGEWVAPEGITHSRCPSRTSRPLGISSRQPSSRRKTLSSSTDPGRESRLERPHGWPARNGTSTMWAWASGGEAAERNLVRSGAADQVSRGRAPVGAAPGSRRPWRRVQPVNPGELDDATSQTVGRTEPRPQACRGRIPRSKGVRGENGPSRGTS
jgi:hypothetical protein